MFGFAITVINIAQADYQCIKGECEEGCVNEEEPVKGGAKEIEGVIVKDVEHQAQPNQLCSCASAFIVMKRNEDSRCQENSDEIIGLPGGLIKRVIPVKV